MSAILAKPEMTYGHNGNAIETITRQRFNDDSSGSTGGAGQQQHLPQGLGQLRHRLL